MEGFVLDENCNCVPSGAGGQQPPPVSSGQCTKIRCQEGSECDPATGTCRTFGEDPSYLPGLDISPIIGPKKLGTLPAMPDVKSQNDLFVQELKKRAQSRDRGQRG